MAPTICSGKKSRTHTMAGNNIRRRGHGSQQLSQALTNIVSFVPKGSSNAGLSASLRVQSHSQRERQSKSNANYGRIAHDSDLNHNNLMRKSATSVSYHRRQPFSFISDNAVTSDVLDTLDLRLSNEIAVVDSTETYVSNTTMTPSNESAVTPASLSEASSSSPRTEETSSPTQQRQARIICDAGDMHEATSSYENDNSHKLNLNKETEKLLHSSKIREHYCSYSDSMYDDDDHDDDDDDEESDNQRELHSEASGSDDSDSDSVTDMDTDNSDSSIYLRAEKSAQLKSNIHRLVCDKFATVQHTTNSSNRSNASKCNTNGLLSIVLKTIKLVKRNQLLQQRLNQLQYETSQFIQSVLANPENRQFCGDTKPKVQQVDHLYAKQNV